MVPRNHGNQFCHAAAEERKPWTVYTFIISIIMCVAPNSLNPLTYGRFLDPYFKVLWNFVFIGASATKSFEDNFLVLVPKDIVSKGQKTQEGGGGGGS